MRGTLGFIFVITSLSLAACVKQPPAEPVIADADIAGIDPNQTALPKDAGNDEVTPAREAEPKPVTDVTLDGKGEVLDRGETTGHSSGALSPPAKSDDDSGTRAVFGSGPQVRYVKATELNIRTQPNRFAKIVGLIKGGAEVRVSLHGGWAKLNDGEWIRSRWLVKSRPAKFVGTDSDPSESKDRKKPAKKTKSPKRRKKQG